MFLIALPILVIIHFLSLKYTKRKALKFANFSVIEKITGKRIVSKNWMLLFFRLTVMSFLIFSVAGTTYWYNGRGSDFQYGLIIDASASMMANDYGLNRMDAAKKAALGFVDSLGDKTKVGIVTFTGTTFLKLRLTDDLNKAREVINGIELESVGGSAVGDSLVTGSNLFFEGKSESNILVLLTDGQSNVGLDPKDAIPYLLEKKVMVHSVGIGTVEGGNFIGDVGVSRLDEGMLKSISEETGGQYFYAKDVNSLENTFKQLAKLKVKRISKDLTLPFLMIGVGLLLVEWGLLNTKYRSLP